MGVGGDEAATNPHPAATFQCLVIWAKGRPRSSSKAKPRKFSDNNVFFLKIPVFFFKVKVVLLNGLVI
jgi:hypothetical protein